MNETGIQKFLSKHEKHRAVLQKFSKHHPVAPVTAAAPVDPSDTEFYGLFIPNSVVNKDEDAKVKSLRQRIIHGRAVNIKDIHILWALRSEFAKGSQDVAYKLLMLMVDSWEGVLRDYKPTTKLLGAINRQNVTCYLDALLFAMFSRLSSFEAMLYNSFDAPEKQRLALMLRLWVNMLRSGELITTDITELLQRSLSECGWHEAYEMKQQDTSEAFTFITSQLQLPLLTLKMDIYHTGKEDIADDHKFINERLLEVAIPSRDPDEPQTVTLEECLEAYFNNRIEVRRYLERRGTANSIRSYSSDWKSGAVHVESIELDGTESLSSSPSTMTASTATRPSRHRAPSIVQQRFIPDDNDTAQVTEPPAGTNPTLGRLRKGSIRKEVMMPAWQIFSLIPWYTDNTPTDDAQVAAHFSSQRPILGMCLKRYSMTASGEAVRLGTYVDIPVEIGLPHFIQDDRLDGDVSIYGNFKLSLQSVVCHRGNSVNSGHYISLVRGTTRRPSEGSSSEEPKQWMRFDDLATERITVIDIGKALQEETPYLLFYQILPIDGDPGHITDGEVTSGNISVVDSGIAMTSTSTPSVPDRDAKGQPSSETTFTSSRPSFDDSRGRSPDREPTRRSSITFSEPEVPHHDPPSSSQQPSRRGSRMEKGKTTTSSRSQSQTSERLSAAFAKLTQRKSREKVLDMVAATAAPLSANGSRETNNSDVAILDGADSSAVDFQDGTTTTVSSTPGQTPGSVGNNGKRDKDQKKERGKSRTIRNRLSSSGGSDGRPDRECVVM